MVQVIRKKYNGQGRSTLKTVEDNPNADFFKNGQISRRADGRPGMSSKNRLPGPRSASGSRVPIYTERVEGKNLWSLLDTVKHQIPIPFSLPELMALYFSSDMMKVFRRTV